MSDAERQLARLGRRVALPWARCVAHGGVAGSTVALLTTATVIALCFVWSGAPAVLLLCLVLLWDRADHADRMETARVEQAGTEAPLAPKTELEIVMQAIDASIGRPRHR